MAIFDIGSTLVDESAAYEHRIRDMIEGTDIPYPVFLQKMLAYFSENKKGDIELARELDMMVPAWHSEDERPYPDAHACLKTLSETYRIGIIANQPAGSSARLGNSACFRTSKSLQLPQKRALQSLISEYFKTRCKGLKRCHVRR